MRRTSAWWIEQIFSSRGSVVLHCCAYLLIAVMASWPLAANLTTSISYGTEAEATVPLLNVWTLWWNADRAANGFSNYWNAPIFHPTQGTFAFSEAQPTMLLVAPIVWLTENRALAYNIYQIVILVLNAITSQRLLKRIGHGPWLAFCGGAMCELLPFVWWQFGVVQLTTLCGITWTVHSLVDLFDIARPAIPNRVENSNADSDQLDGHQWSITGLRLGLSFGFTYWMCNYWGLFLLMLLVPSSVFFLNRRLLLVEFWKHISIAGVVTAVMIGPIVYVQRTQSRHHTWNREQNLIVSLSAHPRDLTDTPWLSWIPAAQDLECPEKNRSNVWPLGGGGLKLMLSGFGLLAILFNMRRRRWGLFVTAMGLAAFGLSLGPNNRLAEWLPFGLAGQSPFEWLQRFVPGFSLIRSPFRFVLFVQLATVWLSVEALALLDQNWWKFRQTETVVDPTLSHQDAVAPCSHRTWSFQGFCRGWKLGTIASWFALTTASLIVSFEIIPGRMKLYRCPSSNELPVWVTWLRDELPAQSPIVCLPFPNGYTVRDYESTSLWMYWATFHRHPLLNGYSGFFPDSFKIMKERLQIYDKEPRNADGSIPPPQLSRYAADNDGLTMINASEATHVVVKRSFATQDDIWNHRATRFRWGLVLSDETAMIDVYEIQRDVE